MQDIRDILEQKLAEMLARNPLRMDFQRKYEEIVADYNREKDRTTIEETFRGWWSWSTASTRNRSARPRRA